MGGVEPQAAKLGEDQGAERERVSEIQPEIEICYKAEEEGANDTEGDQHLPAGAVSALPLFLVLQITGWLAESPQAGSSIPYQSPGKHLI